MKLKRYDVSDDNYRSGYSENNRGDWCMSADVDALEAENESLRAEIERLKAPHKDSPVREVIFEYGIPRVAVHDDGSISVSQDGYTWDKGRECSTMPPKADQISADLGWHKISLGAGNAPIDVRLITHSDGSLWYSFDGVTWRRFEQRDVPPQVLSAEEVTEAGCPWQEDRDGNWETGCGNIFAFTEGGPTENRMKFCPYCGRRLEEFRACVDDAGRGD